MIKSCKTCKQYHNMCCNMIQTVAPWNPIDKPRIHNGEVRYCTLS